MSNQTTSTLSLKSLRFRMACLFFICLAVGSFLPCSFWASTWAPLRANKRSFLSNLRNICSFPPNTSSGRRGLCIAVTVMRRLDYHGLFPTKRPVRTFPETSNHPQPEIFTCANSIPCVLQSPFSRQPDCQKKLPVRALAK